MAIDLSLIDACNVHYATLNSSLVWRVPVVSVEKWCQDYFLSLSALQTADAIRSELTDTLRRIELPVSMPSFGSKGNTLNIKRALLAGFFMQVR